MNIGKYLFGVTGQLVKFLKPIETTNVPYDFSSSQWMQYLLLSHSLIFTCIICMIIMRQHCYQFLFSKNLLQCRLLKMAEKMMCRTMQILTCIVRLMDLHSEV